METLIGLLESRCASRLGVVPADAENGPVRPAADQQDADADAREDRADADLVTAIRAAETELRRTLSQQLDQIAEAERRGLFVADGARTMQVWLRELLNISHGEAKSRVVVARAVTARAETGGEPDLPETSAALRTGDISLAHGRVIAEGVEALPDEVTTDQRAEVDALLAEHARVLSPRDLAVLAERIRYLLDQDGALRDEKHQIEHRELHIGTGRDGTTVLSGRLDREAGAKLRAALEPLAAPLAQEDGKRDRRSPAKRNADALVNLVDHALAGGELPRSGGQRPHITVTVGFDQLRETLQGAEGVHFGGAIDTTELPLAAANARRLACDAEILPVVLDGESRPLDVGRVKRSAPPHLRAALLVRDGKCAFPGCDHPPGTSEAHHVRHWADGGGTEVANMVLLCSHHHTVIHAQGWAIRLDDGRPVFIPPARIDPGRTPRPGNRARHEPPPLAT